MISYTSNQNEIIKRNIQITKNNIQVMLKNIKLSIKLWNEAIKIDVYLCNQIVIDSKVNEQCIISEEAWIEQKLSINHICVWNCKCYFYVNFKSLSIIEKYDKLMNYNCIIVFIEYKDNIIWQYHLFISDLKYII